MATQGQGNWATTYIRLPSRLLPLALARVLNYELTVVPSGGDGRDGWQSEHADGPSGAAWASSGLYVRVALLPRSPSRQTRLNTCFVFMIQRKKLKGPQGTMRKKKK